MSQSVPVQCPSCGWTGTEAELAKRGRTYHCPVCDDEIPVE
jgi:hypothetical protein